MKSQWPDIYTLLCYLCYVNIERKNLCSTDKAVLRLLDVTEKKNKSRIGLVTVWGKCST